MPQNQELARDVVQGKGNGQVLPAALNRDEDSSDESREEGGPGDDVATQDDADRAPTNTPEDLEEGFCRDDVVGKYLLEKYMAENAKSLRGLRGKAARRATKALELEALHHVRTLIVGQTESYYGGFPVTVNAQVEQWLSYFKHSGRHAFLRWLVRGESVRPLVEPNLRAQGLPQELIYLAMVESGFSNQAYSRARAAGTWQFMKGTAKLYGLHVDKWVDERRDPVKSTNAAARFLADLYEEFGDWYLAMAAYNAGPGKIRSAMRRLGTRDFWEIARSSYIRPETKEYVPKVLAALTLTKNRKSFGFNMAEQPAAQFPQGTVRVYRSWRLDQLAQEIGVSYEELRHWNPELLRGLIPPMQAMRGYDLRLPQEFHARVASLEGNQPVIKEPFSVYRVRSGDTLAKIARRYGASTSDLIEFNAHLDPKHLPVGSELAIPEFPP